MQSYKGQDITLYNLPKESKGIASSFNLNPRDWTQVVGKAVDKAND
jgi:hypothetical protein